MKRTVRWLVLGVLVLSFSVLSLSTTSSAQIGVGISVRIGPPALPVYAQPICPGPGYLWTPGYWAWSDDDGYYWVPGTWVVAPVGMLWTPGYWGWGDGFYRWHPGYWGPHVGFYGGINYGFGYGGVGFFGGEWRGREFFYNRSAVNVNVRNVTHVYNRTVVVNNRRSVSFNGPGGIEARPNREEERYSREPHREALGMQREHEHAAGRNRQLFASENHGRPAIAATARPGDFHGHIERARAVGEPYRAPKVSPQEARVPSGRNGGNFDRNSDRNSERAQGSRSNERAMARPENHASGNDRLDNRKQMSSRESMSPMKQERAVQRQDRQVQKEQNHSQKEQRQAGRQVQAEQKRNENANRSQARPEPKHNGHDQRR